MSKDRQIGIPSRTTYILTDGVYIMQRNKPAVEIFDDLPSGSANLKSPDLSAGVTTITGENISELFGQTHCRERGQSDLRRRCRR